MSNRTFNILLLLGVATQPPGGAGVGGGSDPARDKDATGVARVLLY